MQVVARKKTFFFRIEWTGAKVLGQCLDNKASFCQWNMMSSFTNLQASILNTTYCFFIWQWVFTPEIEYFVLGHCLFLTETNLTDLDSKREKIHLDMHLQLDGLMFWHFATTNGREWPKKIAFFREFHILENFLTFIMGHLIPLLLLQERCMMMFSFQMCGRLFKIRESSTDFRRIEKIHFFAWIWLPSQHVVCVVVSYNCFYSHFWRMIHM